MVSGNATIWFHRHTCISKIIKLYVLNMCSFCRKSMRHQSWRKRERLISSENFLRCQKVWSRGPIAGKKLTWISQQNEADKDNTALPYWTGTPQIASLTPGLLKSDCFHESVCFWCCIWKGRHQLPLLPPNARVKLALPGEFQHRPSSL